jgi:rod shape-determining protein MreD
MRWIPFIVVCYVVILLQTSLGRILTLPSPVGLAGPDFAAILAVFVALRVRSAVDCMLSAWILGLLIDLTTGGGPGAATVVGPMPIAYALLAGLVFKVREAFFRDRAMTQVLVAFFFVLLTHGLWVTIQALRLGGDAWADYRRYLLQVLLVAIYSAVLTPLLQYLFGYLERVIMPQVAERSY